MYKIFLLISALLIMSNTQDKVIIDSNLTFTEAIKGSSAPQEVIDSLVLLDVIYYSTDEKLHKGQILINKEVKKDVEDFFELARKEQFPIKQVIPISEFGWDDDSSMSANNSSAFNYRYIAGTKRLSNHSFGRAIDINPFFNPVIYKKPKKISPDGAKYIPGNPGVFTSTSKLVKKMKKKGWRWGGDWNSLKDYHHFDNP